MEKFWQNLSKNELADGLPFIVTSDILDQSEFWSEDALEFNQLFRDCIETEEGAALICFLVGHKNIEDYLLYVEKALIQDTDE